MATLRVGLKQVANGNNRPSLDVLYTKKEKSESKSRVTPFLANVHDKENHGTQATVKIESSCTQTDIFAIKGTPPLTSEDLLCDEPSSSYWRGMADKFEKEIDKELENSFNMSLELDKSYEELENSKNRLKVLMEVLDDILGKEDGKESTHPPSDEH